MKFFKNMSAVLIFLFFVNNFLYAVTSEDLDIKVNNKTLKISKETSKELIYKYRDTNIIIEKRPLFNSNYDEKDNSIEIIQGYIQQNNCYSKFLAKPNNPTKIYLYCGNNSKVFVKDEELMDKTDLIGYYSGFTMKNFNDINAKDCS